MAGALSASDIAFEGFRLTRERPLSILVWSGLTLALSLLSAVLMITVAGDAMTALMNAQSSETQDPTAAIAAFGQLGPVYALLMPASLVFYAVLYAAIYRAVLRPSESPGTGDVRFGLDELRQGLVLIAVGLLFMLGYLVVVLIAVVLIAALAAATGGGALSAVVALVVGLAALGALAWLLVRLSLVAPYTFDRRSIDLPAAWRMTKGHGVQLFGAYLLAVALMIVVFLLGLLIFSLLAIAVGGGVSALSTVFQPDMSSLGAYFTLPMLIYLIVASLLSAMTFAILVGATGAAYRALSPSTPADVFA